jgi:glycosyltransferase involved in cell wall biosynthesis
VNSLQVLHVLEGTAGGLRRHVLDLIRALSEFGLRQGLVYSARRADQAFWTGLPQLESLGVQTYQIDMTRPISPVADAVAAVQVYRIMRGTRPTVLHLHSSKAGGIGRLVALLFPGVQVVYSPHASAANISRFYAAIERFLGHLRTTRLIAGSPSEHEELARLGFVNPRRLADIECGLDHQEVLSDADDSVEVPLPPGRLILSAGRLSDQKNPDLLFDASLRLLTEFPDVSCVWVGDGELRGPLQSRVDRAAVGHRWVITGWVRNPYPLLRKASVFVLPSRYESFGYVTLEAMILGKPVVATNVTGSRDLVKSGMTGYLVDPGDVDGLVEAIATILKDPGLAAQLGRAGAAQAERFTLSRMAKAAVTVYRELGI